MSQHCIDVKCWKCGYQGGQTCQPPQHLVPTGQQTPSDTQTNRKISLNGLEDIQQANPMPHQTYTHWGILQTLCPYPRNQLPMWEGSADTTAHHARVQNPCETQTHNRTGKTHSGVDSWA